jgi:hypothetical protein
MEGGKGNLGLTISIQIGQRIGGGTGGILISRVMMMRMMMGLLGSKGSAEAVVGSTRLVVAVWGGWGGANIEGGGNGGVGAGGYWVKG